MSDSNNREWIDWLREITALIVVILGSAMLAAAVAGWLALAFTLGAR